MRVRTQTQMMSTSFAEGYTSIRVKEWARAVASDTTNNRQHIEPRWLDQINMLASTELFGRDESREDIGYMLRFLVGIAGGLESYVAGSVKLVFVLPYTLLGMSVSRHESRVDAFQVLVPRDRNGDGGNAKKERVPIKMVHAYIASYRGETEPLQIRTTPIAPRNWSVSAQLTYDVGTLLDATVSTYQYELEDLDALDATLSNELMASRARSVVFLRMFGRLAQHGLDDATPNDFARERLIPRIVELAAAAVHRASSAGGGLLPHANVLETRRQIAAANIPGATFEIVSELVETWFGKSLPRMRVLPVGDWATAHIGVSLQYNATIELDEVTSELTLLGFLRNVRRTTSVFASNLPKTIYPFVIPVSMFSNCGEHTESGGGEMEAKDGILVIYEHSLTFVQLGRYGQAMQARRIMLSSNRTGTETIVVTTTPHDSAFAELRAARDVMRVRALEDARDTTDTARVCRLLDVGITADTVRRGAALAPLFDSALEASAHNAPHAYSDMVGLLMFARALADASAAEQSALLKLYRAYSQILRTYLRDVLRDLFGNRVLEQMNGSESSSESDDSSLFTASRRVLVNYASASPSPAAAAAAAAGERQRIDLMKAFALSRTRRSDRIRMLRERRAAARRAPPAQNADVNSDDDDVREEPEEASEEAEQQEDIDATEDEQLRKRLRRTMGEHAYDEELDDDELENIVPAGVEAVPDAAFPTTQTVESVGVHDLIARLVVTQTNAVDLSSLQQVSRVFARQAIDIPPRVYAELWRSKYPLLASIFATMRDDNASEDDLPVATGGRNPRVIALLTRLYARFDELTNTRMQLHNERRALERNDVSAAAADERALRNVGLLLDDNAERSDRLKELIYRIEGRQLMGDEGGTVAAQRARALENRQWTLLMATVDNVAHHPSVRRALLTRSLQPDAVTDLSTVDEEEINAMLSPTDLVYMDKGLTAGAVINFGEISRDRPPSPRREYALGRYYIARRDNRAPRTEFRNINMLSHDDDPARSRGLLLTRSRTQTIDFWALNVLDNARVYSPPWEGVERRGRREQNFDVRGELVSAIRMHAGARLRVVAATTWHNWRRTPHAPHATRIADALFATDANNVSPNEPWQRAGFEEEFRIVAVDLALLSGLVALQAGMPLFANIQSDALVRAHVVAHLQPLVRRRVFFMWRNREVEQDGIAEAEHQLMVDYLSDLSAVTWMTFVNAVLKTEALDVAHDANADTPVTNALLRQTDAVFLERFGTVDAYTSVRVTALVNAPVAATAGATNSTTTTTRQPAQQPTRVFRRSEYHFLRLLHMTLVLATVSRGTVFGVNLSFLRASAAYAGPLRTRLNTLYDQWSSSLTEVIDEPFLRLVSTHDERLRLQAELLHVDVRLEDYWQID